ncbi:MAG: LLM class F420-dependent oxidoreductase [Frankiales bacterium]|nr:LLM class F420-dependent oxidoreductase [Frankiales bacterium]
MSPRVEVSLGLWQDRPATEVIDTALAADELGYGAVWVGEMATWDAFALGTHIGGRMSRARLVLGPFGVAIRDPMMIAMGAASVATLTGREVSVALGTSSNLVVERWHGRDRSRPGQALEESARAVRLLLDGEKAEVPGEVVRTSGYRLRLDAPRSELVVAAFGDRAIGVAARHADRMVLNLVDPASVAQLVGRLRDTAAELGREMPRVAVWTTCAVDPGPAAIEQLRRGVVGYLAAPGYSEMFRRAGFGDLVDLALSGPHPTALLAEVPAELIEVVGLVGDEQRVSERLSQYLAAGADDVVIVPSATDDDPAARHTLEAVARISSRLG